MPDILAALIAFVDEHRCCGDLDGALEGGVVWLGCSCGARLARPAAPSLLTPNGLARPDALEPPPASA